MRLTLTSITLGAAVLASSASAGTPVFANIGTDADRVSGAFGITNFDPNLAIFDDFTIQGGGELDTLTFAYGYTGFFGAPSSITMTVGLSIFLDNGDGVLTPFADDVPLVTEQIANLPATLNTDEFHTITFQPGIIVPNNATLWVGYNYDPDTTSFINLGTPLHDVFAVGSSDDSFYQIDMNTNLVSSVDANGGAFAAELTVVPTPSTAALLALGGLAASRRRRS